MQRGSCLCGAVTFSVEAELTDPLACHCKQCRQQSGHFFAAVHAPKDAVTFACQDGLTWYRASDLAARGFCRECGSTLFWRRVGGGNAMSVSANALQDDHGLKLEQHIWVDDKPDWYEFADDAPRLTAAQASGGG